MVIQHFYPDSERRFYECLLCKESIYNPLCQGCLAEQIQVWMTSYPDLKIRLAPKIKKFLQEVHNETTDAIPCAACGNKKAAICPYCFTEYILGQLKKLEVNKAVIGEFLMFFNFDYNEEGYTSKKEIEQLSLE